MSSGRVVPKWSRILGIIFQNYFFCNRITEVKISNCFLTGGLLTIWVSGWAYRFRRHSMPPTDCGLRSSCPIKCSKNHVVCSFLTSSRVVNVPAHVVWRCVTSPGQKVLNTFTRLRSSCPRKCSAKRVRCTYLTSIRPRRTGAPLI